MTLRAVERGGAGVTIGAYLAVMQVLGLEKDFGALAKADALGRELQDMSLHARSRRSKPLIVSDIDRPSSLKNLKIARQTVLKPSTGMSDATADNHWIERGGFSSSEALADLISSTDPVVKKDR